jgi:2-(1,2-epoxy-1,2-dihydrophenyl)acetyl-CoA isomerase
MTDPVLLAREGPVATLTLNRPASLNALDATMIDALAAHSVALASDAALRCVVICGAGKHFMAGGDIRYFAEQLDLAPTERRDRLSRTIERVHAAIEQLQRMPHPIVASVHGAVAGFGLSLMCACDLVIAADTSYFTSAYRQLGLTPDGGLSYALPRHVGLKKAMEILLLSERFGPEEALRLGLVNRVVPEAELARATAAVVAAIVSGPAAAIRNGKRLLQQSLAQTLAEQLRAEAESFGACSATDDFIEGVRAFLDKRPPRFGGGVPDA